MNQLLHETEGVCEMGCEVPDRGGLGGGSDSGTTRVAELGVRGGRGLPSRHQFDPHKMTYQR
jgi:hypothetical protein